MSATCLETNRSVFAKQAPIQINQSIISRIVEVIRSLPVGAQFVARDVAEAIPGVSPAVALCTLRAISKHNIISDVGSRPAARGAPAIIWQVTPWNRNWVPNASPRGMARSLNY